MPSQVVKSPTVDKDSRILNHDATEPLTSPTKTASDLPKKDRKKFKKLRKRATNCITESEQSGLLTYSEWSEFQIMMGLVSKRNPIGPSIDRRKRKEGNKVEGSHHRDILAWMLRQIKMSNGFVPKNRCSKKRSRDQAEDDCIENPSLPSWASVHNPGTVNALSILEVHVPKDDLETCRSIVESVVDASNGRRCLTSATKWFQGHVPRTMSDSLLYFVKNHNSKRQKLTEQDCKAISNESLMNELKERVLDLGDWPREGYPFFQPDSTLPPTTAPTSSKFCSILPDPSSLPLDEAKKAIASIGFRVQKQNEEDPLPFVCTNDSEPSLPLEGNEKSTRVFGMDCEMVLTDVGSELARITLIQFISFEDNQLSTKTIMDTLVKPNNPVKDYLTRHSGITAEKLNPVETRLEQVQWSLHQFLRPTDILVGHSLENDLIATHYLHPQVVDTALLFRHRNKRTKFSLRHLAATLLKKTIQRGSHCSEEDAKTTLDLAIRKAWLGDTFGVSGNDEKRCLFEMFRKDNTKWDLKSACIGPSAWLNRHVTSQSNAIHALGFEAIPESKRAILSWLKAGPRKAHLTLCNMRVEEANAKENFEEFRQMLSECLQSCPPTTMFLVAVQENFQRSQEAFKKRRACKDQRSTIGWSNDQEEEWQANLERSRFGFATWIGSSNVIDGSV